MSESKEINILAIESSCDETAAAVVKNGREVLSNVISSQIALHTLYGGVVPEIASRKHIEKVNQVVQAALDEAHMTLDEITAITVTYGPGLVGALLVGVAAAKAIACAAKKPLVALCAYGLKCGISERRIRQDAYSFLEHLESLTDDEDNHFTREDVKDALKALKADNKLLSTMASREWIEKQTKVVIPPNKRNGRKQATHLKIARFTLETMNEDRGKALQGRPDKAKIVEEWRESNPLGTKADCIRETGLAKHTVYKWWK